MFAAFLSETKAQASAHLLMHSQINSYHTISAFQWTDVQFRLANLCLILLYQISSSYSVSNIPGCQASHKCY